LTKEQAVIEASRCLLCDDVCSVCVTVCPNRANYTYFTEAKEIPVFKISRNDSAYKVEPINTLQIQQKVQVLNIADFCNECGNCTTFCPTKGAPYKDKPKFYLTEQSFSHAEKGFLLKKDEQTLLFKNNGVLSSLKRTSDYFRFENDVIKAVISQSDYSFKQVEFKNATVNAFETSDLATMIALIDAAKNLY
jgi:putative selenate reductase